MGKEDKKNSDEGGFGGIFLVMLASIIIASLWDKIPVIKNTAHFLLNPSAGALLEWNIVYGMLIITFLISLFITIIQKYGTNQAKIREMKEEQKRLAEESKKFRDHPEKMMELQKESMKILMPLMKLGMKPIVYTAIPLILFFRWFNDFFGAYVDFRFFGFLSWFWFYLIGTLIFSSVLRKILKVV